MSVFRLYNTKSNTIASGIYENYNSGQNHVAELWYGGGGTDTAIERRHSISRFIMQFDLTDLRSKFNTKEINENLVSNYVLKLKNAIPRDKILDPEYEFDRLDKSIASSFSLVCFPLDQTFDEGRGYDLYKQDYLAKQKGNLRLTGYSNWLSATSVSSWSEPGVYINPTASTSLYTVQHFDIGDEDLEMDITSMVRDWLSGSSASALGIAYTYNHEIFSTDTRFISSFFTEKTNTAFKPYIQVNYNQIIEDDRNNVTNNRTCRLFLYTFSGNNPCNYYSASTVKIQTAAGSDIYTGLTPTNLERGVYYVDVLMSGTTPGQMYKDVWEDITFVPGVDQQTITQNFQIKKNYYTNNIPQVNNYSVSIYGLDNNSKVGLNELIRIYLDIRVNFSTKTPETPFVIKYRLMMNNQLEVIPWTRVNRIVRNSMTEHYFNLDTSWLLHNQTYKLEFKIEELGTSRVIPEGLTFKVMKTF